MPATHEPARERSPIPGISRNVFLLGIVSFFTDASSEMLYPLIPLFLTQTLGAPVSVVGLIEGVAEATASLLKGVSGWLSDRLGARRPFVIFGYGLAAITKPLLALAHGWALVLVARVLDRFGKGMRGSPRDAIIADSTEERMRGRAFGFHRSADQTGAVLGPLLALPLLAAFGHDLRTLFVVAFIPAAAGVLMLMFVRETGRGRAAAAKIPMLRWRDASPEFRRFLLITLLFAIGNSADMFLILRARQLGLSTDRIMLLFAMFNAVYVLSAWPAGFVSDRLGRRRVIVAGYTVFSLVYLGVSLVTQASWIWPLFAVYGLYQGLTDGVIRAFVVDLVGPEHRGAALGLQAAATGIAAFPASAIGGLLWQWSGPQATFLYGAVTAAAASLLLAWWRPKAR